MAKSKTNETTRDILNFLFSSRVFAWRQNTLPIPVVRKGIFTGFRPGSKLGIPDICGIIQPGLLPNNRNTFGVPLYIEIKTGKDRLRPEQIGFIENAKSSGAIVMVVKSFDDFESQWKEIFK